MMLDAMCVDLAAPLDGKRYSMLDLPVSYTKQDLTAVLQKACDRENNAYFQINDIMQEGVKLSADQRVDYYGIRGGALIWSFNAPVKVRARLAAANKEHDLWLRQIERGGASTVEVDPNDADGIQWLNDNRCSQSGYAFNYDGRSLTCSALRNLAYTSRATPAKVDVRICSVIQVLVRSAAGVQATTVRADDTGRTLKNKYNLVKNIRSLSVQVQRFSYGGQQLADSSILCNVGITDGDTVNVTYGGLLGGCVNKFAGSATFADVSAPGVILQWSKTAPRWRWAQPGLCLEGVCTNKNCGATSRLVMNYGIKDFDLMLDNKDDSTSKLKCPMCNKFVKATSCGLNNCVWRMTGMKAGSDVTIATKYTAVGDHYYTFKETPSVEWTRLIVQVQVNVHIVT
jgi:Ubiquitin family